MSPDQVFSVANAAALLTWVLLAAFPRHRLVRDVIAGTAVPAGFATAYLVVIGSAWSGSSGGFSSLAGVAALFSNPWLLLAGWIHYLAFDLLIGTWEVRDAQERGVPHVFVLPCLALTFLFGPAGWLLYRAVRAGSSGPYQLIE
jgi:Domain of unknown function (DUF4281)